MYIYLTNVNFLGAKQYSQFFMEQRNDFLDVLSAFPSCLPKLPRLIGRKHTM